MSIRFGAFLSHYEDFWHNLQVDSDFQKLRQRSEHLTLNIQTAKALTLHR